MNVVLAVDIGTSTVKALALSEHGEVMATANRDYPTYTPQPGWVEHNPDDYVHVVQDCLRQLSATLARKYHILGLGLTGHMSALVALDAYGNVIRPALAIADTRGSGYVSWLEQTHGDTLARTTGNAPLAAFVLPKLLWYRDAEPDNYSLTRTVLGAKDYVRYKLTDQLASEPTEAGNTLLLSQDTRSWNTSLMDALNISPELFPPLQASLEPTSTLNRDAANACNLPVDLPVITGLADMAASVLGCGLLDGQRLAITLGTSGQITQVVDDTSPALLGKFTYHPHALAGKRYVMASVFTGGLALTWLADLASSLSQQPVSAQNIINLAAQSPAGARGVTFIPHLVGAGSPTFQADARGSFIGLTRAHTGADMARAVLEGVAFNIRHCLEELTEAHPLDTQTVVAGGGMRVPLWRQIIANVTGKRLMPLTTHNAGLMGIAFATGVGVGMYPSLEFCVQNWVTPQAAEAVDDADREAYDKVYESYLEHVT